MPDATVKDVEKLEAGTPGYVPNAGEMISPSLDDFAPGSPLPPLPERSKHKGPAGTRVLIEPVNFADFLYKSLGMDRSKSKIIFPDSVKDPHQQACDKGIVREIGACAWADQPGGTAWAEVGDLVDFVRHSGVEVQLDEKRKWRVVNDVDIYYNHGKQF